METLREAAEAGLEIVSGLHQRLAPELPGARVWDVREPPDEVPLFSGEGFGIVPKVALTVGTVAIKAAGPAAVGGRELPPRLMRVIAMLAPALLAALIMVETFGGSGRSLALDARAAGLVAAATILVTTESLIGAVIGAAAATALLRLIA